MVALGHSVSCSLGDDIIHLFFSFKSNTVLGKHFLLRHSPDVCFGMDISVQAEGGPRKDSCNHIFHNQELPLHVFVRACMCSKPYVCTCVCPLYMSVLVDTMMAAIW